MCREAQLHALFELISTGHLSRAWFEPVLHLDEGTLDPGEREYLAELRELG